jgi:hypothetical protein
MQLKNLCPDAGANLRHLMSLTDRKGWQSALPSAFGDEVLLQLAYDFRCVEERQTSELETEGDVPSLAQAIYICTTLLAQHPLCGGKRNTFLTSVEGVTRTMQLYQLGLEREIVGRITGIPTREDPRAFADALWHAAK